MLGFGYCVMVSWLFCCLCSTSSMSLTGSYTEGEPRNALSTEPSGNFACCCLALTLWKSTVGVVSSTESGESERFHFLTVSLMTPSLMIERKRFGIASKKRANQLITMSVRRFLEYIRLQSSSFHLIVSEEVASVVYGTKQDDLRS